MTRTTHAETPSMEDIYARLDNVHDPELDDSILRLGFIDTVDIDGSHVSVHYKVPTFWCAPNFTFIMSSDIRSQVLQVPGVERVTVLVRNNCAEHEINAGINAGLSFQETFPDDATEDLDQLRRIFAEKSFLARQDVLLRRIQQAGLSQERVLALRVGDVSARDEDVLVHIPEQPEPVLVRLAAGDMEKYLRKWAGLGLDQCPATDLFITLQGVPLREVDVKDYLRRSRAARLNIAFNTTLCEGLLRATYHPERLGDTSSLGDALLTVPQVA